MPGQNIANSSITYNVLFLYNVPPGFFTVISPDSAPAGTVAVISVLETILNVAAGTPPNLTALDSVRLLPRMISSVPTLPAFITGCTNGRIPALTLNTVPTPPAIAALPP